VTISRWNSPVTPAGDTEEEFLEIDIDPKLYGGRESIFNITISTRRDKDGCGYLKTTAGWRSLDA
jgi:hypothetical protein